MTITVQRSVARADLCRTAPFAMTREGAASGDAEDDGRTIDGYATVYGRDLGAGEEPSQASGWAFIDSWEGTFWERFRFGAFRKALRETTPRMQFDHGRHPLLGSLPLGVWTSVSEEQDSGLHTVGRLSDNWLIEPFRDALRDRAVDGMSIRFEAVREEWRDAEGRVVRDDEELVQLLFRPDERGPLRRTITEAKLPEAGPVTWPAYQATSVGIRSVTIDLGRLRDPAQRSILARAVLLTDAADGDQDQPPTTGTVPAGGHRAAASDPPSITALGAAGGHESVSDNRPRDAVDRAREAMASRPFDAAVDEMRRALATLKES